ncbi:MAG: PASTA domain-containing protein [Candidatus Palauibacterales bacterium]|nr:PASTA domain-containing protein [Candidatus Palauibacterales bacterium]MDP2528244.1 PASTA domain-containing protein [Candidatus Palauibacterales bacterium]MDP2584904.1 PASTA domain-containing protein [Candidatus Palauibacterales bacterium]
MKFRRRRGLGGSLRGRPSPEEESAPERDAAADEAGAPPRSPASPGRRRPGGGGGGWLGPRQRRRLLPAVLLVGLFALGYLVATRWIFPGGSTGPTGDVARVPDLVGLATAEATRSLGQVGLTLEVGARVPHPKAPEGAIIAQTPLPGQYARPGAPVQVTLSSGPERRKVPDLRGLSARQGRIVLERLGFTTAVDSTRSDVQRGQVVGSRPDAGQDLQLPAQITVLVSRGPAVARVPDLSGRHVEDVPAALRDVGLSLGEVTYDPAAFAAAGRVIAQDPPPGFSLRRGGSVSIRVAGQAPRTPPDSAAASGAAAGGGGR